MSNLKSVQNASVAEEIYAPVFEKINQLSNDKHPILIGIDGSAGSGKSSLAKLLFDKFDCQVFHMDDFFLPFEMKTEQRLQEPGGNVHYERFLAEVLRPLKNGETISYHKYDCKLRMMVDTMDINSEKINIVEGVYSFHPLFLPFYNWKLFLKVNSAIQVDRIKQREGTQKLQRFINEWIPLENHYFSTLEIEQQADLIIDTSDLNQ
ncbi:hypothetical protein [Amphibacillus indicireducens]|uniref:AAA family ATPase n=1 Tax=Amphibacillus indicireducens TaxID=1076330 RepID=A0ABP7VHX9_9BACI